MDPVAGIVSGVGLLTLAGVVHAIADQVNKGGPGRNSMIGLRTAAIQSSDSAWRAGHHAAGPWLVATAITGYGTGLLTVGFAVALLLVGDDNYGPLVTGMSGYGAVIVLLIVAVMKANGAARATSGK